MQPVLTLNATFEPIRMLPMKTAVRLIYQQKAEVLEEDPTTLVRSERMTIPRPLVIRLKRFVRVPSKFRRMVTNTFLFARDSYTCQYCGRMEDELGKRESLTRDHVVPQSRGGQNTWENCVTACSRCNTDKADKSLTESGLVLLTTPGTPNMVSLRWSVRGLTELQRKYIRMFYGDDAIRSLRRRK